MNENRTRELLRELYQPLASLAATRRSAHSETDAASLIAAEDQAETLEAVARAALHRIFEELADPASAIYRPAREPKLRLAPVVSLGIAEDPEFPTGWVPEEDPPVHVITWHERDGFERRVTLDDCFIGFWPQPFPGEHDE